MKKAITILLISLFFLILLGLILFKLLAPASDTSAPPTGSTFPVATDHVIQDQNSDEINQVKSSFLKNIDNANEITLENAKIVLPYALQAWSDENKGGEALLKHDDVTRGWQLISLGGGAWDVESLVAEGVPADIARKLIGS